MIKHLLDREQGVLHLQPESRLEKADFEQLAAAVDPYIEETGGLAGLILETPRFPGWESFGAATRHIRFVRDHHRKIRKIALVTDSWIGGAAEHITNHFVAAEIRHFPSGGVEAARTWITEPEPGAPAADR